MSKKNRPNSVTLTGKDLSIESLMKTGSTKPFRFRIHFRNNNVYAIALNEYTRIAYGIVSECEQSKWVIDIN